VYNLGCQYVATLSSFSDNGRRSFLLTVAASCGMVLLSQEVHADKANLTEFQQRLVECYLHEAQMNGIEKLGEDRKIFMQILHQLLEDKRLFQ